MKEYLDLGQFPEAWIDKDGTHAYIDDGPDQITCEKEKLYPEDHRFLLGFPDKDLTTLTELAEEYAVDDKEVGSDEWTTAINGIKNIHPYYNAHIILRWNLLDYTVLTYWKNHNIGRINEIGTSRIPEWMKRKLAVKTYDWLAEDMDGFPEESTLYTVQLEKEKLLRKITFLLDNSNKDLAAMPYGKRMDIYSVLYGFETYTPKTYTLVRQSDTAWDKASILEFEDGETDRLRDLADNFMKDSRKPLPDDILSLTGGDGAELRTFYIIESLEDLLETEVWMMIRDKVAVRRCENCGRLFVQNNDLETLCDYKNKNGESCRSEKQEEDRKKSIRSLYRLSYQTHFARIKAGTETKAAVDLWREKAKNWEKKAILKELDEKEYKELLLGKAE